MAATAPAAASALKPAEKRRCALQKMQQDQPDLFAQYQSIRRILASQDAGDCLSDLPDGHTLTEQQRSDLIERALALSLTPGELKAEINELLGLSPLRGFAKLAARLTHQSRQFQTLSEAIIDHIPYMQLSPGGAQRQAQITRACGKLKDLRIRAERALEHLQNLLPGETRPPP